MAASWPDRFLVVSTPFDFYSVIPGLVMAHEHLYYPTGPGVYGNLSESFTRLYLAGGVTSMRTGGRPSSNTWRARCSSSDSANASREKSGHSSSRKTSSE